MGVCNVLYTIPAISLLGILIPFTGIGNRTAVTALTIYGIMPMVRNTYVGLTTLDRDILEAARGMGGTELQTLLRIRPAPTGGSAPAAGPGTSPNAPRRGRKRMKSALSWPSGVEPFHGSGGAELHAPPALEAVGRVDGIGRSGGNALLGAGLRKAPGGGQGVGGQGVPAQSRHE